MHIYIIIASIMAIYGAFATIFHSTDMVGNIGRAYGEANLNLFGHLAYIDLLIVLYPLYRLHKERDLLDRVDFYVGWILFFISLILLQSLTLEFGNIGNIGSTLKLFLLPYIGKAGLWLLWLMSFLISIVLMVDRVPSLPSISVIDDIVDFIRTTRDYLFGELKEFFPKFQNPLPKIRFKNPLSKFKNPFFDKQSTDVMVTIISQIEESPKSSSNAIAHSRLKNITSKNGNIDDFILPSVELLADSKRVQKRVNRAEISKRVAGLLKVLKDLGVKGGIDKVYIGPAVMTFEFKPSSDTKISKVLDIQDDLVTALGIDWIRVQKVKSSSEDLIAIEVPNSNFETIYIRDILDSRVFKSLKSPLTIALGKDTSGKPYIVDLKKLPHLFIVGANRSDRLVGVNSVILSLIFRNSPDNLKLILIDSKPFEFSIYRDIPHLLTPIVTDLSKANIILKNIVKEMDRRYKLMAEKKSKNIDTYNRKVKRVGGELIAHIVVVVRELADLMVDKRDDIENYISKLTKMARVSGIHLVVATQKLNRDILTDVIKLNFPSRLCYRVRQKSESKTILGIYGAERLLGNGDGLFISPITNNSAVRVHTPMVGLDEIRDVIEYLKSQRVAKYDNRYLIGSDIVADSLIDSNL